MPQQEQTPLLDAIAHAVNNPSYQFHIPGHTRGEGTSEKFKNLIGEKALLMDTTDEFDGIGTLNPPTGPIKEAEDIAAKAFNAQRTFFLLNGSTVGNIAIAMALTKAGKKVIVNRNCHRSIMTGLIISGAQPLWVLPRKLPEWGLWGNVHAEDIENLLKNNNDVSLVWITNPTYEGVVSDIKAISEICKKYNVPLIVDEAHGCLWNFSKDLPETSLNLGADVIVHSLHKTGGSLSQSSMLHVAKNSKINLQELEKTLKLLHTTSPSIPLLASLDAARANLQSQKGQAQIHNAVENARYLRKRIDNIKGFHQLKPEKDFQTDITKIFIKADGISGKRLESILEYDFNVEVESASDKGLLILSNIGNKRCDFEFLADAFEKISKTDYSQKTYPETQLHMPMLTPEIKINLREAFYSEKEIIPKEKAIGRIAGEIIAECPPGIAILVPGELIKDEHIPYLEAYECIEVLK